MMEDVYLPDRYKGPPLGDDYQRIANELRDNGTEIDWTPTGLKLKGTDIDISHSFMYPHIFDFNKVEKTFQFQKKNT